MVSSEQYYMLESLYNKLETGFFKKNAFVSRNELCLIVGISATNSTTYNRIIKLLEESNCIIAIHESFRKSLSIEINKSNLEKFIKSTEYFKSTENFIVNSGGIAIT